MVVTTKDFIFYQYLPLIKDDVIFIPLAKIHEVEKMKHGLLQNILNYGNIKIMVEGSNVPYIFTYVKHPAKLLQLIQELGKKNHN